MSFISTPFRSLSSLFVNDMLSESSFVRLLLLPRRRLLVLCAPAGVSSERGGGAHFIERSVPERFVWSA